MKLDENMLKNVTGGETETSGLNCPECGGLIATTIHYIIGAEVLVCPHCDLRIPIEHSRSQKAILALRKVKAALKQIEERE